MATLKDTLIQGSARVTDTLYSNKINLADATASLSIFTDANKNLITKSAADARTAIGVGASGTHADSYFVQAITSTDNNIPRFNSTAGQLQGSRMSITDNGLISLSYNGQYPGDIQYSNAAGLVGESWLDTGHATNVSSPRFYWRVRRPKSTATTTTESVYEQFRLPAATAGTAASATYEIITTKNLSNITSVGTITSGVWNGSAIPVTNGGTGATTAAAARTKLGLGSIATYDAATAGTMDTWGLVPVIGTNGVLEVGKYIDFHTTDGNTANYDVRITAETTGLTITGTTTGTFSGNLNGTATKATGDKNGLDIADNYLKTSGGTVSGTLTLSKTQAASGTANNSPALIVGGAATSTHLEFDSNKIMAKTNGTSVAELYLNKDGGLVHTGSNLRVHGNIIYLHDSGLTKGTNPSSERGQALVFNDSGGVEIAANRLGRFYTCVTASGNSNISMWAYQAATNGTENAHFTVSISKDAATKRTYTDAQIYGAVWNDYAEYRKQYYEIEPGHVVKDLDNGRVIQTEERLVPGAQVVSDTFGFAIGETEECKTPLAVSGRVLAYPYRNRYEYHAGMAVCSAPNGTVDIMTREEIQKYPDAIVGIVSEIPDYEIWGETPIKVNNRIWIKVK